MPVERASTVHTTILDALEGDTAEIQGTQFNTVSGIGVASLAAADITCTSTTGDFIVHYNVGGLADTETVEITAFGQTVTYTFINEPHPTSLEEMGGIDGISGTVGGNTDNDVVIGSAAVPAIVTAISTAGGDVECSTP